MKCFKIILAFLLIEILTISLIFAKSSINKSELIKIDGNTSDFDLESDQIILSPDLFGKFYESDNDSKWGSGNDVFKLKLTWDAKYLYIGIDGVCWGNNIICYIQTLPKEGISDVSKLSAWKRNVKFENIKPNFFLATWDNNEKPQFWKIINETSVEDKSSQVETKATFKGSIKGGMEAKINWDTLYGQGEYRISTNASLKIVTLVVGGETCGGPDSMPNSSVDMPVNCSETPIIDNFVKIDLDKNYDGLPDMNIDIRERAKVEIDTTSSKYQPLKIYDISIENRSFTPNNDGINDEVVINYKLSKDAKVSAKVFNFEGEVVYDIYEDISLTAGSQKIKWNGLNNYNILEKAGIYIIFIKAKSGGVSFIEKIPVYLVK